MSDYKEQRYEIKFMVKVQKKPVKTYRELKKMYGDACMSEVMCLQWHAAFRKSRDSCELQGGPSAPVTALSDVTVNTAGCLIVTDHHLNTRELAGILDISLGSVHTLLHDHLNVSHVCACWIPHLLTPEQKKQHVTLCEYWSECVRKEGDGWWKTIITADESWIYAYDPATKQQSMEWVSDAI